MTQRAPHRSGSRRRAFAAVVTGCLLSVATSLPAADGATTVTGSVEAVAQELLEALSPALKQADAAAQAPEALPTPGGVTVPLAAINPDSPIELDAREGLVSLSVRDASLRQVLSALAETEGLNLVIASPADAPVTAKFERLPLRTVLDALLSANGHTWTQHGSIVYVTSVAAGTGVTPEIQGRRVAVIELDFASASDLQAPLNGLLSPVGQSFFLETDAVDNRRTKEVLIVEDLDPYVARVEQYIAEADQPPRQVLIEVHLLQVNLTDDQRTGVNFDALMRASGANLSLRTVGLANPTGTPAFFLENEGGDLDALIEALIATTDAKSLAAPRLLALNGQTARMQIGERLGYRVTTTTETSSLESVEFLDVGVVLSVTPRITRDGRVLMHVEPEVSTGAVNPDTGVPDSETTKVETDLLLASGQGMVIGGLIQERDDINISRVPVLGNLPYVNFLFQRRTTAKRRFELVVALVPHVFPYEPVVARRDAEDFARAFEPLLDGPLCRHPRPYEPRLADPLLDKPRIDCLTEADDPTPGCETPGLCPPPEPSPQPCAGPRRLPAAEAEIEEVEGPTLAPVVEEAARPHARWFR